MAFVAVLLDRVIYEVKGKSVLDLSYGKGAWNTIRLLFVWSLGAGLGGFLGAEADIFKLTRLATISVGVGWPLILPRLLDSLTRKEDDQEPEQP
jgi:hypothetical protein